MTNCSIREHPLRENINLVHTTELGIKRIKRNLCLRIADNEVETWLRQVILNPQTRLIRSGKNWYAEKDGYELCINASSYTVITAHFC